MLESHFAEPPQRVLARLQGGNDGNTEAERAEGEGEAEEGEEAGEGQRTRRLSPRNRESLPTRSRASITKLTKRGPSILRLFCKTQGERFLAAAVHDIDGSMPIGIDPEPCHTRQRLGRGRCGGRRSSVASLRSTSCLRTDVVVS